MKARDVRDFVKKKLRSKEIVHIEEIEASEARYSELEHNFFGILNLVAGFRFEYFRMNSEPSDTKVILRAGATLKLMQETYLRMSLGQGYRYPTIAERFIRINLGKCDLYPTVKGVSDERT